jgi:hypothetical protein
MPLNLVSFEQRLNFIGQGLWQLALLQVESMSLVKFVVQLCQLRAQFFVLLTSYVDDDEPISFDLGT